MPCTTTRLGKTHLACPSNKQHIQGVVTYIQSETASCVVSKDLPVSLEARQERFRRMLLIPHAQNWTLESIDRISVEPRYSLDPLLCRFAFLAHTMIPVFRANRITPHHLKAAVIL